MIPGVSLTMRGSSKRGGGEGELERGAIVSLVYLRVHSAVLFRGGDGSTTTYSARLKGEAQVA